MKHRVTLPLLLSFCTFLSAVPLAAQTTPTSEQDDVVRITTNLVQIDAVVTKDGKPVPNLKAEDFEIYEEVRRQLRKFVAEQLQPNDLVAIVRTSGEIGTLQQFTNDRRLLNRAVDHLRWNVCSRVGITIFPRYGQALTGFDWDNCDPFDNGTFTALHVILDGLARLPGRKSMILMSDDIPLQRQEEQKGGSVVSVGGPASGGGPASLNLRDALQKIAEKAIRSSVVIYSVDTQGLQITGLTAADNVIGPPGIGLQKPPSLVDPGPPNALMRQRWYLLQRRREGGRRLAQQTGGFQVANSNGFQLDRILEDQGGYYLIGYRPTEETFNRKFHHIQAKVNRSGMTVRTRSGFYGVTEEEAKRAQPTASDETNLALGSPFGAQDLEINLNSFFFNGYYLQVVITDKAARDKQPPITQWVDFQIVK